MTQTPRPQGRITYPSDEQYNPDRPSLEAACRGNRVMGSLLNYFMHLAEQEAKHKGLDTNTKVITISVHKERILQVARISEQTFITYKNALKRLGYVKSQRYSHENTYEVNFEAIEKGIASPPARTLRGRPSKKSSSHSEEENAFTSYKMALTFLKNTLTFSFNPLTFAENALTFSEKLKELELKLKDFSHLLKELELKLKELELSDSDETRSILLGEAFFEASKLLQIITDSHIYSLDDFTSVQSSQQELDYFEKETICPECGNLTADPQACLHNFPIGSTTPAQGDTDGYHADTRTHSNDHRDHSAPSQGIQTGKEKLNGFSGSPVTIGNATHQDGEVSSSSSSHEHESEHRANATIPDSSHPQSLPVPGLPGSASHAVPRNGGGAGPTEEVESEADYERRTSVAGISAPGGAVPGLPACGSGSDLPVRQALPIRAEMEREQEADDAVTSLEQTPPKPAESPPDSGAQPSSDIQQVSRDPIAPPPLTPGQHSGQSLSDTPVTSGAAQAGQEKTRRTRKPPTPKLEKPQPPTLEEQLSEDEMVCYLEWCSLFHVAIPLTKALVTTAKQLAAPCATWAKLLGISRKDVLKDIKDYVYRNDTKKYYKDRGVKFWDCLREFEGWQEIQEKLLEEQRKRLERELQVQQNGHRKPVEALPQQALPVLEPLRMTTGRR